MGWWVIQEGNKSLKVRTRRAVMILVERLVEVVAVLCLMGYWGMRLIEIQKSLVWDVVKEE